MPFNPEHLLNGIAFAHGLNESEKSKTPKVDPKSITPEHQQAMQKLHKTLVEHHLNEMMKHAKHLHTLTGGK